MKKISIIIIVAIITIVVSLICFFSPDKGSPKDKEITWNGIIDEKIENPDEYAINKFKEGTLTYGDIDFTFIYPSDLSVDKVNSDITYYGNNMTLTFDSTMATYDEFVKDLQEKCKNMYEKCTLQETKIDEKTYAFVQDTLINNIYQEEIIIFSNNKIFKYYLENNKFPKETIEKILKEFSYKSIPSDKYSYCDKKSCTIDFKDFIGYKLTVNYDNNKYQAGSYNIINASSFYFHLDETDINSTSIRFNLVYAANHDAINELDELKSYEDIGEETIGNKTFKHYYMFEGETKENSYDFSDIYLDIVNPNLLIKIEISTSNDTGKEIIREFTNYELS